ncbi:MAG: ATP-binding protein [Thermoguttaceae bacterium]
MRKFVTTGLCVPSKHYMADTSEKITKIRQMIDEGLYFTINRGRQYGKTTTLLLLERSLKDDYTVISICFQGQGDSAFASPKAFCQMLLVQIDESLKTTYNLNTTSWLDESIDSFQKLGLHIKKMCRYKKFVLFIDEVDKTSTNQTFLDFLGMLREKFLFAQSGKDFTFHSVVLAGVHDIKNIKQKLIREGKHELKLGEGSFNSPWNIAVNFTVDMSLNPKEIASMLSEYENDHKTGMDIAVISQEIHNFTSGYPFLVSRICQIIEDGLSRNWTTDGVQAAVKRIINEKNTLFDDMFKNMDNNPSLYELLYDIVIKGDRRAFSYGNAAIDLGATYCIVQNSENGVAVSNKIFELVICNKFVADDEMRHKQITGVLREDVIHDGKFDMALCIKKFAQHYYEMFADRDFEFYERHGRLLFLAYLQPLINGNGFYHIEPETRNTRRMDIVVDYGKQQFIVELKLWKGDMKHDAAYEQLLAYMNSKNLSEGYLLTFDFRLDENKERKSEWVDVAGKRIYDVVV